MIHCGKISMGNIFHVSYEFPVLFSMESIVGILLIICTSEASLGCLLLFSTFGFSLDAFQASKFSFFVQILRFLFLY